MTFACFQCHGRVWKWNGKLYFDIFVFFGFFLCFSLHPPPHPTQCTLLEIHVELLDIHQSTNAIVFCVSPLPEWRGLRWYRCQVPEDCAWNQGSSVIKVMHLLCEPWIQSGGMCARTRTHTHTSRTVIWPSVIPLNISFTICAMWQYIYIYINLSHQWSLAWFSFQPVHTHA